MNATNDRKNDHINAFSEDAGIERHGHFFDAIQLQHRALPEIDFDQVSTQTTFLRRHLSMPFIISSMTGGQDDQLVVINQRLAQAAQQQKVALAVGSQRIMLSHKSAAKSFEVRQYAPDIPIIANIGAVQLNYGVTIADIQQMVKQIDADALYLHLNPLQECIQPEGNRNFSQLINKITDLNAQLDIPIFLKEVGCGFSLADLRLIQTTGIQWLDVAGRGGTSWSRIENHRRATVDDLGMIFQDWGIPTPHSIRSAKQHFPQLKIIASGGVRNGIDMLKSLVLGADLCAMAAPLLKPAQTSTEAVQIQLQHLQNQLQTAMFLCGVDKITDAHNNPQLLFDPSNPLS